MSTMKLRVQGTLTLNLEGVAEGHMMAIVGFILSRDCTIKTLVPRSGGYALSVDYEGDSDAIDFLGEIERRAHAAIS